MYRWTSDSAAEQLPLAKARGLDVLGRGGEGKVLLCDPSCVDLVRLWDRCWAESGAIRVRQEVRHRLVSGGNTEKHFHAVGAFHGGERPVFPSMDRFVQAGHWLG